jgi:hypothetical protein
MKKSSTIILIIVIAIVFVAVGIWVGIVVSANRTPSSGVSLSPYSAVYLSTGDIYFGRLVWFPTPHIEDAWFLQRGTDAKGNPTAGVYPFSQIAWGAAGDVYLNSKQIIFWTRLSATSSVAQVIENPSAAVGTANQQVETAPQIPVPATSSTSP